MSLGPLPSPGQQDTVLPWVWADSEALKNKGLLIAGGLGEPGVGTRALPKLLFDKAPFPRFPVLGGSRFTSPTPIHSLLPGLKLSHWSLTGASLSSHTTLATRLQEASPHQSVKASLRSAPLLSR